MGLERSRQKLRLNISLSAAGQLHHRLLHQLRHVHLSGAINFHPVVIQHGHTERPGAGGTQRLPRLIGIQKSFELITQGTELSPAKAKGLGIVNDLAASPEWKERMATRPPGASTSGSRSRKRCSQPILSTSSARLRATLSSTPS